MRRTQEHYGLFEPGKREPVARDWFEPARAQRLNRLLRELGSPQRWKVCRAPAAATLAQQPG